MVLVSMSHVEGCKVKDLKNAARTNKAFTTAMRDLGTLLRLGLSTRVLLEAWTNASSHYQTPDRDDDMTMENPLTPLEYIKVRKDQKRRTRDARKCLRAILVALKEEATPHRLPEIRDLLNLDALLRSSAFQMDMELAELVVQCGADFRNAPNNRLVVDAVVMDRDSVVRLLLILGADVHAHDDLALTEAVKSGLDHMVFLLCEKGADTNARNGEALTEAVERIEVACVRYLIMYGANVHVNDDYAWTVANRWGIDDIVDLLRPFYPEEQE
jgi:hypothetical protein